MNIPVILVGGGFVLSLLTILGVGWLAAIRDARDIGALPLVVMTCGTPILIGMAWGIGAAVVSLAGAAP